MRPDVADGRCALLKVLLVSLATASPAAADHYDIQPVAIENATAAPGGGVLTGTTRASGTTAAGEVLVAGYVWDGVELLHKVFLFGGSGAGDRVVVEAGEAAPGGGTWSDFEPVTNTAGDVAFNGAVDFAIWGAWKRDGSGDSVVAVAGGAAPLPGATWTGAPQVAALSDGGTTLFFAAVSTGSGDREGWFVDASGGQQAVVLNGDAAPGGGTFTNVVSYGAALIDDDSVVFQADVSGGATSAGLYRWDAGILTPLFVAGDPVPTPGGGSFDDVRAWPAAGASGAVAFVADVVRGANPALPALFVLQGGTLTEVLYTTDPVPGSAGLHFAGAWDVAVNASGQLAFTAPLMEAPWSGLFFWDGTRAVPVVLAETPHPAGGAEFYQFGNRVELEDGGRIVFDAGSTDLSAWGVFTATPALAVPALPPGGTALLAVALAAAASAALRRRALAR